MRRCFLSALLGISLAGFLGGCSGTPAVAQDSYWPDAAWRTSSPEAQGIQSAPIAEMLREIRRQEWNIHSVLIVRHGWLVTEVYFPPYAADIRHPMHSITKSVTSAMTGIAIRDGLIESVRQKVLDFFPEIAEETNDKYLKTLTLERLLTMSAGFNTNTLPDFASRGADFDAAAYILTHSNILWKPGETFFYDSGLPHVVSAVIRKAGGRTLEEYARSELFGPLGITDFSWQSDPQGVTTGYSGLSLRPRDMAKLGYLYLRNGVWKERQILPSGWVKESTARHMETMGLMNEAEDDGYGYYWWFDSFGGYSAHGHGGQYIFVLPGLDMVVVFTAGLANPLFPAPHRLLEKYLLPAAQSGQPLEEDPGSAGLLAAEIAEIQNPQKPVAPLPEIAGKISGKTFRITGAESAGWPGGVTFTFPGGDAYTAEWTDRGEILTAAGGLDNVFRLNRLGTEGETVVALRGSWKDDHTFVEEVNFNLFSDIQFYTVTYEFDGDKFSMTVVSGMGYFQPIRAEGELVELE